MRRVRALICAGLALLSALISPVAALAQAGGLSSTAAKAVSCRGHFVNPITDTCWSCLLPISLGAIPIIPGSHKDSPNPASPICVCPKPPPIFLQIGLSIGFWEPARLADSTRKAWCFPSLGGISFPVGFGFGSGSTNRSNDGAGDGQRTASYHVHWYIYPLMYWLELLTDFLCLEQADFDVAYVTELDPLWHDDELATVIEPESLIFANPIALAACAADCAASTVGLPLQPLFWCAGCRGEMYPMTGNTSGTTGDVDGSLLAVEKFTFKMHRMMLGWETRGSAALCQKIPVPIIDKLQYRMQLTNPVPNVAGPFTCPTIGASTQTYEVGKEVPVIGEDFGYLIWRKRNCCAGP